jgi:ATP-dependent RNA helicase SUPV3L1/SUV3
MLRVLSARQCARICIVQHRGLARVRRKLAPLPQLSAEDDDFADLTMPHQWYPAARRMQRKLIAHIGPTNSGKSYAAIKALKGAMQSVFCAPLRLLAWEVHTRLNAEGHLCNLVTGQELVTLDEAGHTSCTIEMCDLSLMYDVAVLDEAQLLGDPSRGWAWTRALLGLQAREIHLCGSETMIPLLEVTLE